MQTTEAIKRRISSTEDLQSVVKTMKALAAVSIRQYEKAVESLTDYSRAIELGFQALLKNQAIWAGRAVDVSGQKTGVLMFGSDQGMVGQFNEQVLEFSERTLEQFGIAKSERIYIAVGMRLVAAMEDSHYPLSARFPVPSSVGGITSAVQELLLQLESQQEAEKIGRVYVFGHRPRERSGYEPYYVQILPVDPEWFHSLEQRAWPTNNVPMFTIGGDVLFSRLVRQYLFVTLYRAYAESLASENASRLASMQAAEKNIEENLDELNQVYQHQRQTAITSELLDIVSGFKALTAKKAG
jgi:F-type H+-transporting ATPase subunit gamma